MAYLLYIMTARARVIYWRRHCPLGQKTRQNGRKIFNGLIRESAALRSRKCKVALGNLHRMHSRKCKVALRAVNGCAFACQSIDSKSPLPRPQSTYCHISSRTSSCLSGGRSNYLFRNTKRGSAYALACQVPFYLKLPTFLVTTALRRLQIQRPRGGE